MDGSWRTLVNILVGVAIGLLISQIEFELPSLSGSNPNLLSSVSIEGGVSIVTRNDTTRSQIDTSPLVEDIIPEKLRKRRYGAGKMAFEVSTTMLRSSRPIVGNTERLHHFIRKLSAGRCTTVLIMGGSVSGGHNVRGGPKNAYPQVFIEWLNERYPCEGGSHTFKKTHATNSPTHFSAWGMVESIPAFDLVLLEFNVNGKFMM